MAVTIKDVAKMANVSPSTVSRVIANNPRISEKTKRRVRETMKQLGYHPNFHARSLANKSTDTVGVVMPSAAHNVLQNPFFPEVLRGISTKAYENRYGLYLSTGTTEEEIFEEVVTMVQGRRVDGIILLYSRVDDQIMNYLEEEQFPFTVIGKPYIHAERITHVDNDNYYIAKEVTDYLIQLGHERIAFVGGNLDLVVTRDRMRGYQQALIEAEIPFHDEYTIHEKFLKEGGRDAIAELLSLDQPPTALVVSDDLMAFGMLSHLDNMNVRVPEDISIISFNNIMLSDYSRPPLTSVDINIFQLGFEAANCLIEKIKHPNALPKRITIPAKMIKRQSCYLLKS
ncbi:LacI family DNA-binding transcriptional regulator [Bacillus taeanensis]|uniref:LacI family transcriptional regulator n=1 Tax=Bacillus taeanensis TaxID=273032 RepID=A0A366XZC9_9BACI|nr:LacI family DNA-binding transcriptional regulator [Bacillus taeanensis]RBW69514.1 LacI family transcriptional regulator [Bacillus taeanensis]